jgi:hypothetical protein
MKAFFALGVLSLAVLAEEVKQLDAKDNMAVEDTKV